MKRARTTQLALDAVFADASPSVRAANPQVFGPGGIGNAKLERRQATSRARKLADLVGREAEALVVGDYHAAALASGRALMIKVPTPTDGPSGHRWVTKRLTCDSWGFSLRGPRRAILEEIKATAFPNPVAGHPDPTGPIYLDRVKDHQCAHLELAHRAGHLAVLTVVFGRVPAARVYVVEWATVRNRTCLAEGDCWPWRCSPDTYLKRYIDPDPEPTPEDPANDDINLFD